MVPGCGERSRGPRCAEHEREHDAKRRPNAYRRGYNAEYAKARQLLKGWATFCHYCGGAFTKADPMTAGHVVPVSRGGTVADGLFPAHRSCNSAAGNK
jgi:5-methylcytosine-specific restriction endonuclease McrA